METKPMEKNNNLERAVTVIAGTLLVYFGARKRSLLGGALAVAGAGLVRRGALGGTGSGLAHTSRVITIDKPKEEVYRYWRNFENLPRFMTGLKNVKVLSPERSRWIVNGPGGRTLEWDAELTYELENEAIAWRSLPGARIPNRGTVLFDDAVGNRGTVVRVSISYRPPWGLIGAAAGRVMGQYPEHELAEGLRRLKSILESGQVANRAAPLQEKPSKTREAHVQDASESSFPASDAPAYR